jgi:hypothetical protein
VSTRIERFTSAVLLAQQILEGPAKHDELRIQQALDDIRDEVEAGRKNQAEWPAHAQRALELIDNAQHSVRVPTLRVVK